MQQSGNVASDSALNAKARFEWRTGTHTHGTRVRDTYAGDRDTSVTQHLWQGHALWVDTRHKRHAPELRQHAVLRLALGERGKKRQPRLHQVMQCDAARVPLGLPDLLHTRQGPGADVCVCSRMYVCVYVCVYARMNARIHVCMYACMHACMHTCMI